MKLMGCVMSLLLPLGSAAVAATAMDTDQAVHHLTKTLISKREGQVARVKGDTVYISAGEQDGILDGSQFDIVRLGDPIKLNGELLGYEETPIAKAAAHRVREHMTIAKLIERQDSPRTGDRAYLSRSLVTRVVVAPFLFNDQVTGLSESLQEGLTTAFLKEGVAVVERSQLEQVLAEQQLGYSGLVKLDSAKKLGQLLGADTIVIGTLRDLGDTVDVTLRLVALESGMALSGAQARIAKTPVVSRQLAQVVSEGKIGAGAKAERSTRSTASTSSSISSSQTKPFENSFLRVALRSASLSEQKRQVTLALLFENISEKGSIVIALKQGNDETLLIDDKANDWILARPAVGIETQYYPDRGSILTPGGPVTVLLVFKPRGNEAVPGRVFDFSANLGLGSIGPDGADKKFSIGLRGIHVN